MTPLSFRIAQTLLLIGLCILLQSITEKIKDYHRDDRPLVDMKIRSTFSPTTPKCTVGDVCVFVGKNASFINGLFIVPYLLMHFDEEFR